MKQLIRRFLKHEAFIDLFIFREEFSMFIFNLTFIKPLSVVERAMDAHNAYLDQHYADGTFLCSGGVLTDGQSAIFGCQEGAGKGKLQVVPSRISVNIKGFPDHIEAGIPLAFKGF